MFNGKYDTLNGTALQGKTFASKRVKIKDLSDFPDKFKILLSQDP